MKNQMFIVLLLILLFAGLSHATGGTEAIMFMRLALCFGLGIIALIAITFSTILIILGSGIKRSGSMQFAHLYILSACLAIAVVSITYIVHSFPEIYKYGELVRGQIGTAIHYAITILVMAFLFLVQLVIVSWFFDKMTIEKNKIVINTLIICLVISAPGILYMISGIYNDITTMRDINAYASNAIGASVVGDNIIDKLIPSSFIVVLIVMGILATIWYVVLYAWIICAVQLVTIIIARFTSGPIVRVINSIFNKKIATNLNPHTQQIRHAT